MLTPFEYVLPLAAVLVGLAIADVALSLHRLLRARRRVRWDVLPLAAALLAVLALLEVWWRLYEGQATPFFATLGGFLGLAAQLVVLFLLNAAALPDEVPDGLLDLRAFYEGNASYYWTLFAAYIVFVVGIRVAALVEAGAFAARPGTALASLVPNLVLLGLFVLLARVRSRRVHAVAVVLLIVLFLASWAHLDLTAV